MRSRVIQNEPDPRPTAVGAGGAPSAGLGDAARVPSSRGPGEVIRRRPLVAFLVLAFVLSWVTVPFGMFMAAGPLVASLVVLGIVDGRAGLRDLGRRMLQWRVGWPFYAVAVLVPLAVAFGAGGLTVALGASSGAFARLELSALALAFVIRMVVPLFAPLGEEPGWRGYALPRLQGRHSPFVATLVLGVIVAVWHVPLVFIDGEHFEPAMVVGTVAVTFFYTWLFDRTGGSVLLTMIAHAADGLVGRELVGDRGFSDANTTRYLLFYSLGWVVVAAAVLLIDRRLWWTRPSDALPGTAVAGASDVALARRGASSHRARRATAVAGATVVAVVLVAGAGVAGAASSRDGYIAKADAVCRAATEEIDVVVEDLGFSPRDAQARRAATTVVAVLRGELVELRALVPPAADTARVERIYAALERGVDRIDERPSRLTDEPGPFAKSTRLAEGYGLAACGRG